MTRRGAATLAGPASGNGRAGPGSGDDPARGRRGAVRRRQPALGRRARMPELVVGVLLVAGGALAAVLLATDEPTQQVLVATRDIRRGESFDASVVRWAGISGDRLETLADPGALSGRLAAVDIPAGSPLLASMTRPPTQVGAGRIEVGLALDPGDYPLGLAVGDQVLLVVVPRPPDLAAPIVAITLAGTAEVLAAPPADLAAGERAVIGLLVNQVDLETLAVADDVRLARVDGAP